MEVAGQTWKHYMGNIVECRQGKHYNASLQFPTSAFIGRFVIIPKEMRSESETRLCRNAHALIGVPILGARAWLAWASAPTTSSAVATAALRFAGGKRNLLTVTGELKTCGDTFL